MDHVIFTLLADESQHFCEQYMDPLIPENEMKTSPQLDSDREIESQVRRQLQDQPYNALHALDVKAHGGTVTLHGRVGTYYEKQVAIQHVLRLSGVHRLVVDIDVE